MMARVCRGMGIVSASAVGVMVVVAMSVGGLGRFRGEAEAGQ